MPAFTLPELVDRIPHGAKIALPPDYSGCAMDAVIALTKRPVRDLHIVGVPVVGFQGDILVGAGCVARLEAAGVTLGEHGLAPRFTAAIRAGEIEMWDATCPALHAGLQAAEKGVPFMPLRGIIGSDLLRVRPDWRVIQNPVAESGVTDPIVVLPAIKPDIALFHAHKADRHGNVWVGVRRELMLMAHAARQTLVTVEEIVDGDLLADPVRAAGTISSLYVTGVSVVPHGSRPIGLAGLYEPDHSALSGYVVAAKSREGFDGWLAAQQARVASGTRGPAGGAVVLSS